MKAIAVCPGKPNSAHLTELSVPRVTDIPNGLGVLVKVLQVGVDGTHRKINAGEDDAPPKATRTKRQLRFKSGFRRKYSNRLFVDDAVKVDSCKS
jgi:hypothetical protein